MTEEDTLVDLFDFENADVRRYSDRAAALIVVTILEQGLEHALSSHFIELDENERRGLFSQDDDSPLSSFASRVRLAYALGIFGPKTRGDLTCIRNIRNTFAHTKQHINFASPQISAACDLLQYPQRIKSGIIPIVRDPESPREKYVTTAQYFTMYFYIAREEGPLLYKNSPDWADMMD